MPGLVPGIHAFVAAKLKGVDARDERGHDASRRARETKNAQTKIKSATSRATKTHVRERFA